MRASLLITSMVFTAMLCGCANKPPPLVAPLVQADVSHFVGTPLSGPQAGNVAPAAMADSWVVTVNFVGLETMPPLSATEPLDKDQRIKLILATRRNHPIVATGRLMQGVRIVPDAKTFLADLQAGKYGRSVPIRTLQGALPLSTTVTLGISDPSTATEPLAEASWVKTLELEFGRSTASAGYDAAVLIADLENETQVPQPSKPADEQPMPGNNYNIKPPPPTTPPIYQREVAIYNPPPAVQTFALLAPMQFASSAIKGVLMVVEISPVPTAAIRAQANQEALKDLRLSNDATAKNVVVLDPPEWPGLSTAVAALSRPQQQRQALSYMASSAGAKITADAVLSADTAGLATIAETVAKDLSAATAINPPPGRKYLGWVIEKAGLKALAAMQAASKLSPELSAALTINCGQAGRDSSTFLDVIAASSSEQDLDNHLAAANFAYLEDSAKAARVRAFDWLSWRGLTKELASAGYDPRAKLSECRAALRKYQESTTQPVNP